MSHPSAVSGAFGRPFTEQVAFFRRKLGKLVPTQRWDDLTGAAHDDAFMVAGATKADLLSDLAAAVDKAIAEGRGVEEFRRDFRDIVRRNGWTGWTGEGSNAGEAWRVKTILRTNAYTSYSAGRHAQLLDGDFAYWVYRHGDSAQPRPMHVTFNGLALPPSHAFWIKYYPPSDWGCSCYVLGARTEAMVRRLGGDLSKTLPAGWDRPDPKTGEPKGIGRGWGYAPGASVAPIVQALAAKVGNWDRQIMKGFMGELPTETVDALSRSYRALPSTADDARRYAQRVFEPKPELGELAPVRTLGPVPSDQVAEIEALTGSKLAGYDFTFDRSAVEHVIKNHTDAAREAASRQRQVSADDFAQLPKVLSEPDSIVAGKDGAEGAAIEFRKVINGDTFTAVMVARGARRRELALKTLYIKVGK